MHTDRWTRIYVCSYHIYMMAIYLFHIYSRSSLTLGDLPFHVSIYIFIYDVHIYGHIYKHIYLIYLHIYDIYMGRYLYRQIRMIRTFMDIY